MSGITFAQMFTAMILCFALGLFVAQAFQSLPDSKAKEAEAFDAGYDRMVNALIDAGRIELNCTHTVRAGDLKIWISNYPYSYGHPYACGISEDLKLSMPTKAKLRDHVAQLSLLAALTKAGAHQPFWRVQ